MKKLNFLFIFIASFSLIISSCSIEKRQYTKGYYIEWNTALKSGKKQIKSDESTSELTRQTTVETMVSLNETTLNSKTESSVAEASIEPLITAAASNKNLVSKYVASKSANSTSSVAPTSQVANNKVITKAKSKQKTDGDVPLGLLYVLCILLPFVAVGIVTDWDVKTVVINLLWSLLCGIPGIIHAFIVVSREY